MNAKTKSIPAAFRVVATAHTTAGLRAALRLGARRVGFVEVRLDAWAAGRGPDANDLRRIKPMLLLTARHPAEGGSGCLSSPRRRELLEGFLPLARAVDVELRSVRSMAGVLAEASRQRALKVISFHDFRGTPTLARLRGILDRCYSAGADIAKIAVHLHGARDLAVLLQLQAGARRPLATMGMGPLGRVSRLVLAAAGSRLNYGYLDKPQVPGQWPALELVRRIGEVLP